MRLSLLIKPWGVKLLVDGTGVVTFGATGPMKPGSPGFLAPGVEGMTGVKPGGSGVPATGAGTVGAEIFAPEAAT
jgi:hypothetical protein